MRADAKKNYQNLLSVARDVVSKQGTDVSMRDIARRAEVGLATLLRHFPTREALVEAMLCSDLEALKQKGDELERMESPGEALAIWFRAWMAFAQSHRGIVAMMAAAHANPDSALYASCASVHAASARLLHRAQAEGQARVDMTGDDLFGLMSALGWIVDLPSFAPRAEYLSHIVSDAILSTVPGPAVNKMSDINAETRNKL